MSQSEFARQVRKAEAAKGKAMTQPAGIWDVAAQIIERGAAACHHLGTKMTLEELAKLFRGYASGAGVLPSLESGWLTDEYHAIRTGEGGRRIMTQPAGQHTRCKCKGMVKAALAACPLHAQAPAMLAALEKIATTHHGGIHCKAADVALFALADLRRAVEGG